MSSIDSLSDFSIQHPAALAAFLCFGTAAAAAYQFAQANRASKRLQEIVASPLETVLPKLSEKETAALPYPPDALPGARDVITPYGSVRVYEFGPETGRKVLLVHGISTPCISLATVALNLVEKGCRVMLFGK